MSTQRSFSNIISLKGLFRFCILLLFGINVRERPGIARRADADLGVHALVDGVRDLRDLLVVKLLRVFEEQLLHPWQANLCYWSGAYLQQPRVEGLYQGPCAHLRGDEDLVPLPSLDRVIHQDPCKFADPCVSHHWFLSEEVPGELIIRVVPGSLARNGARPW